MPKQIRLIDFKTGYEQGDHLDQLKGYGWLALQVYPEAESVWAWLVRIRDQQAERFLWNRAELDAWAAGAARTLGDVETYRPGPHCAYCPRGHECPAKRERLRECIAILNEPPEGAITPAAVGAVYDAAKLVEDLVDWAKASVKVAVTTAGGRLPLGDGRELVIVNQEQKRIDAAAAWPILTAEIKLAELLTCVSLGKEKVGKLAKNYAPRRQKGKAVKDLFDRLDKAGALVPHTVERLEVKRAAEIPNATEPTAITAAASGAIGTD